MSQFQFGVQLWVCLLGMMMSFGAPLSHWPYPSWFYFFYFFPSLELDCVKSDNFWLCLHSILPYQVLSLSLSEPPIRLNQQLKKCEWEWMELWVCFPSGGLKLICGLFNRFCEVSSLFFRAVCSEKQVAEETLEELFFSLESFGCCPPIMTAETWLWYQSIQINLTWIDLMEWASQSLS